MKHHVVVIGGGLAGSEAALQLAERGVSVSLIEMRPFVQTPVHHGPGLAELVCSNSLKAVKADKPAGMLKREMASLGSFLLEAALDARVPAGGALAVDRTLFSQKIDELVAASPEIERITGEALSLTDEGVIFRSEDAPEGRQISADAVVLATGPLTSDALAAYLESVTGGDHLAFFDAAAPIVMADSLNHEILFRQSRYEDEGVGDYLNAPMNKEEYDAFIAELIDAKRVIARDFETSELFCACQPIEEIARRGFDAPRHGTMKPVGLTDPRTGRRPWAAVQLRAEDVHGTSYNLVGFQTNLTFPEQERIFRMIPGLENAEFARYGVMHRNTFVDAPRLLTRELRLRSSRLPVYLAGQVAGTEGYCEAMMAGLYASIACYAELEGIAFPAMPDSTAFGSLVQWASDPAVADYQPMHVNFGVYPPLEKHISNRGQRYVALAAREQADLANYREDLIDCGLIPATRLAFAERWMQDFA